MKFMNKKFKAMSPMGYAIVAVVVFAFAMIVSAPYIVSDSSESKQTEKQPIHEEFIQNNVQQTQHPQQLQQPQQSVDMSRIDERFMNMEARINAIQRTYTSQSNRYICKIEGKVDNQGNIVSVDEATDNQKFVFVCEYKN